MVWDTSKFLCILCQIIRRKTDGTQTVSLEVVQKHNEESQDQI